jgi:hypothetical protein
MLLPYPLSSIISLPLSLALCGLITCMRRDLGFQKAGVRALKQAFPEMILRRRRVGFSPQPNTSAFMRTQLISCRLPKADSALLRSSLFHPLRSCAANTTPQFFRPFVTSRLLYEMLEDFLRTLSVWN